MKLSLRHVLSLAVLKCEFFYLFRLVYVSLFSFCDGKAYSLCDADRKRQKQLHNRCYHGHGRKNHKLLVWMADVATHTTNDEEQITLGKSLLFVQSYTHFYLGAIYFSQKLTPSRPLFLDGSFILCGLTASWRGHQKLHRRLQNLFFLFIPSVSEVTMSVHFVKSGPGELRLTRTAQLGRDGGKGRGGQMLRTKMAIIWTHSHHVSSLHFCAGHKPTAVSLLLSATLQPVTHSSPLWTLEDTRNESHTQTHTHTFI